MEKDLSLIFDRKPETWGARGNPYLWDELQRLCIGESLDTDAYGIANMVCEAFEKMTGKPLTFEAEEYVDSLAHGGMSSGIVTGAFWISVGIPFLIDNLKKVKAGYPVVTLCGSTRFKDAFMEAQKRLTLKGNIVISVGLFGHSGDQEVWDGMDEGTLSKTKEMLDDMHKRKIDMADSIYVINVGGYIGESTKSEIEYAKLHGKEVMYLEDPQESVKKEGMINLSYDAAKILEYATGCMTGNIEKTAGISSGILIPGRKTVLNMENQCESARWNAALEELLTYGFIRQVDQKGCEYQITTAGSEYIERNWADKILFNLSYDEYVGYLLEKYGAVPGDYYLDPECKCWNETLSRAEDGLMIHHIDEDVLPGLTTGQNRKRQIEYLSFEHHRSDRLVYCHCVEHMILHMKIMEKELTRKYGDRYDYWPVGLSGFFNMVENINILFTGYGVIHDRYMSESKALYFKSFSSIWTSRYVKTLKYFVENIERREDYQQWFGAMGRFENVYESYKKLFDLLELVHRIYNNNCIEYKGLLDMGDYKGVDYV